MGAEAVSELTLPARDGVVGPSKRAPLLVVDDLVTTFGAGPGVVRAVNGMSLEVLAGESVGIVGESGCGKSVSMLSIMRLLREPPASVRASRIEFDGNDILGIPAAEMSNVRGGKIGMVFQDPMTSLNPVLTIGAQIRESVETHLGLSRRQANAHAADLLGLVGIPDATERLGQYPHHFSGGMRQRAMIAIAVACGPQFLIADEPTTALDVTIQAQILEVIRRLQRENGMALALITHDLGVVAGMCDRVLVMYAGHVVEQGRTRAIFRNPMHPYTQGLLRAVPRLDTDPDAGLVAINGSPPNLAALPAGCPYQARCPLVIDRCLVELPDLRDIGSGHYARCWRTGDVDIAMPGAGE